MKRLIFGLAAVMLAGAFAAFTTPKTTKADLLDSYFAFNTAYSPTKANVEDESKWNLVSDMTGCPAGSNRACKIRVSPTHVTGSTLNSSAGIQATEVSGVAYVTGGQLQDFANRSNP